MFDQWYSEEIVSVRVRLEYHLVAPKEERIIWMDTVETKTNIPTLEVVETVKGFETALQENILQALDAIDEVLYQRK